MHPSHSPDLAPSLTTIYFNFYRISFNNVKLTSKEVYSKTTCRSFLSRNHRSFTVTIQWDYGFILKIACSGASRLTTLRLSTIPIDHVAIDHVVIDYVAIAHVSIAHALQLTTLRLTTRCKDHVAIDHVAIAHVAIDHVAIDHTLQMTTLQLTMLRLPTRCN